MAYCGRAGRVGRHVDSCDDGSMRRHHAAEHAKEGAADERNQFCAAGDASGYGHAPHIDGVAGEVDALLRNQGAQVGHAPVAAHHGVVVVCGAGWGRGWGWGYVRLGGWGWGGMGTLQALIRRGCAWQD